ncbi:hypothetical protein D9M73_133580 [compost metagenome]
MAVSLLPQPSRRMNRTSFPSFVHQRAIAPAQFGDVQTSGPPLSLSIAMVPTPEPCSPSETWRYALRPSFDIALAPPFTVCKNRSAAAASFAIASRVRPLDNSIVFATRLVPDTCGPLANNGMKRASYRNPRRASAFSASSAAGSG